MSDRVTRTQDREAVLRAPGVAVRDLTNVSHDWRSANRQFPFQWGESMLGEFQTSFKKAL